MDVMDVPISFLVIIVFTSCYKQDSLKFKITLKSTELSGRSPPLAFTTVCH